MIASWYLMSVTMPFCFTLCILLTVIQTKALQWNLRRGKTGILKKKMQLFCLYGLYLMGAMCAILCALCHISNYFATWFCVYGMSICVILYATTKTFLYGFFFEIAKCVQSTQKVLPHIVAKYIIPSYIALYLVIYLILCPLSFRGSVVDPIHSKTIPTGCIFGEYQQWVFFFGVAVDVFNSVFFLTLFVYPLYAFFASRKVQLQANHTRQNSHAQSLKVNVLTSIKYNIVLGSICMMSSVTFLLVMAFAETGAIGYYLWFSGNIDIMINCLCVFWMLASNRSYIFRVLVKQRKSRTKIIEFVSSGDGAGMSGDAQEPKMTRMTSGSSSDIIHNFGSKPTLNPLSMSLTANQEHSKPYQMQMQTINSAPLPQWKDGTKSAPLPHAIIPTKPALSLTK